jgi:3-oxoacyl-[acyl-carrier-protein] synthase II
MQPEDRMSLVAAKLALEDAGLEMTAGDNGSWTVAGLDSCATIIGTGMAGLEAVYYSWLAHNGHTNAAAVGLPGRRIRYNRMIVPQVMANSPAAWVSILFGLTGASQTVSASCASGTMAVGEAFRRIRHGYCDTVLAGGVENLGDESGAIMRGFDVLGVLSRSGASSSYPFSQCRDGFIFAEGGACVLLLEELSHARRRGARIYAEIGNYVANSDAAGIVQMNRDGTLVRRLLRDLVDGQSVDYCNAHGTATQLNDTVEAAALEETFRRGRPPIVNSTKALLGHTLGASGAIEAAVTALSIERGMVHGMPVEAPASALDLARVTLAVPVKTAISTSYGFGGHNAGILLERVEEE